MASSRAHKLTATATFGTLAALLITTAGPWAEPLAAAEFVKAQGMSDVKTSGYRWGNGCNGANLHVTGYTAVSNGKPVSGVVCNPILKPRSLVPDLANSR